MKMFDLSRFRNKKTCNIYRMFDGCAAVEEIYLPHFNFDKMTNDSKNLFEGCSSLKIFRMSAINVESFNRSKINQELPKSVSVLINEKVSKLEEDENKE